MGVNMASRHDILVYVVMLHATIVCGQLCQIVATVVACAQLSKHKIQYG